ncbi:hypothetical protein [Aliiglaciecola litoralis]|uniref:Class IIb bacteriocin, lactobin A/cerein 7B family n=1 Tax=Aliiglaciecola litoralis TaxID=582857 RepID=A0ABP3WQ67_9ALTE
MKELNHVETEYVSGGLLCGGLCVLGAIGAGIALFTGGMAIGDKFKK